MKIGTWLLVARAPFLTAVAVPVLVGTSLAWYESGVFLPGIFVLTLLGSVLVHAGANLVNEHGDDLSGADRATASHTLLSGGSGVIQAGALTRGAVLLGAVVCLSSGGLIGLYLNAVTPGNVVLLLGAFGVFIAWSYSERPLLLGYRGWLGELAVGLAFGPLPVLGAHYVQTRVVGISALAVSIPVAILVALVLLVNGLPDAESDRSVGKRTLVVALGPDRTVVLCHWMLAAVYVSTAVLMVARTLPLPCLLSLGTAPLAWYAASSLRTAGGKGPALTRAGRATVALHAAHGVLLSAGLALDRLL